MNLQSKFGYCITTRTFKYCILFVSGTELRTDGQTNGQTDRRTDGRTIRLLDALGGPFRPGHKNIFFYCKQLSKAYIKFKRAYYRRY